VSSAPNEYQEYRAFTKNRGLQHRLLNAFVGNYFAPLVNMSNSQARLSVTEYPTAALTFILKTLNRESLASSDTNNR